MNLETVKKGMIVKSKAGRDSSGYYAVVKVEGGFVYIADGKRRKLAAPKKKNPLHLQKTLSSVDMTDITDKKLRTALRAFDPGAHIAEESD